ncbi:hypothetical protein, partial [Porphyromonas gingivalis]|uniref:hypothetical protein n=1 Tax=Porphyromonas gingivalis TaxID=837 RepID=UPI0003AD0242
AERTASLCNGLILGLIDEDIPLIVLVLHIIFSYRTNVVLCAGFGWSQNLRNSRADSNLKCKLL